MEAKEGHEAISYLEGYQVGKKVGRKEVVDWVEGNYPDFDWVYIERELWDSKLKDWGIDG